jgi:predicted nucleic acid-binding protein
LEASGLTGKEVNQVLDVLVAVSEPVEIKFLWRPQLRDAADEMVLETAVNGMADAIVTFNEKDFRPAPKLFGVSILRPKKVLDRITL